MENMSNIRAIESLDEITTIIKALLNDIAEDFISVGFYLKKTEQDELYKQAGYRNIWEYAKDTFGIGRSTASRFMDINTKYNDFIITGLRTMWGIRIADIRERFGEEKQTYLEQQAATYLRQGLLIRENDTLTLSKKGIFISDGIMSDLLWV